ncbi:MAG: DUF1156 domain-containing protein [Candidatus Eisenbacteria bacterium]|nr:DUF1156 domain-containing protein [Candidatus Eisenbacteria bacterium]
MTELTYPKRLIEVDLPIRAISGHARREKSIRHGHMSTLHIWWARRPLTACRAVLCASLWPDPADEHCPKAFRDAAASILCDFAERVRSDKQVMELSTDHWARWRTTEKVRLAARDSRALIDMRHALLDFIADFSNWDASANPAFVDVARRLTAAAHHALGGQDGTTSEVMDPFAGGGSIPLEALRIGAGVAASDLNPVAVLINKVALEYIPKYGPRLATEIRRWGRWMREHAEEELRTFYPTGPDGTLPLAYIWARTIRCEGPACGAEVPMMRFTWLAKKKRIALRLVPDHETKEISLAIVDGKTGSNAADLGKGTAQGGSVTCPVCGYTTKKDRVRVQLGPRNGGSDDARLMCVVAQRPGVPGRVYRLPTDLDVAANTAARRELQRRKKAWDGPLSLVPDELIPQLKVWKNNPIRIHLYGMKTWGDLFSSRQALAMSVLLEKAREAERTLEAETDRDFALAVAAAMALVLGRQVDRMSTLCFWHSIGEKLEHTFSRQALSLIACFPEANPFSDSTGSFANSVEWVAAVADVGEPFPALPVVRQGSATQLPLADDSIDALFTDPPYYDAVPYGELSDFFYVWFRRVVGHLYPALFGPSLVDKTDECVFNPEAVLANGGRKDAAFFQRTMQQALAEGRRVVTPDGIGVVVFAHKTTAGWEAQLQAMLNAGWVITASWPIDTEMNTRLRAQGSAALASSIHLVCRPRERADGSLRDDEAGSWRAVLGELPQRIHEWMPRLAQEGVVGADAIFACLGPALEIFSRYPRVEKASGDVVPLKEYLEQIWAAVSKEALSMMFDGADAGGLEEDARLTAMWLWTLGAGVAAPAEDESGAEDDAAEAEDGDGGAGTKTKGLAGFVLEFDAARKIAQGLGAHLDKLTDVVEVKGDKARLLAVAERAKSLFSKDAGSADETPTKGKPKGRPTKKQLGLFAEIEAAEKDGLVGKGGIPKVGETTLDRVHQAMILFGAGRSEALKRFVVEEGVGKDTRFWKLAQSLSALYPVGCDEKRWVDGVLARKKSLGF